MDRRQIAMKLTVDGLGLPFRLDSFNHRLILQKAIYVAQAGDICLGYDFRWYLRGPYSAALARDAFAVAAEIAEGDDESSSWRFDKDSQARVESLAGIIPVGNAAQRARRLELLASVHFLVNRGHARADDVDLLVKNLRTFRKAFSQDDVQAALHELDKHGLFAESPSQHRRR